MKNEKKSFILHKDSLSVLDELTDKQAGKLFKAIKAYQFSEDYDLDQMLRIAFSSFKSQFIRDDEKYEKVRQKRIDAGSKGGKAKADKYSQSVANASKCQQDLANLAVSDSVSVNDSVSVSGNDKDIDKPKRFMFKSELLKLGVSKEIAEDWLLIRKNKKATNTKTALEQLINESKKAGMSVADAVKYATGEGWAGFKASWLKKSSFKAQPENFDQTDYGKPDVRF